MEVKELRKVTKLSQSNFAKLFGIPLSTLQAWEQERRIPPPYVPLMMEMLLKEKGYM